MGSLFGRALGGCCLLLLLVAVSRTAHAGWPGQPHRPPVTIVPPPGSPPPPVYGFPTQSYRWGWYNTHYWPRKVYHHGFYGDYSQWGYQPGY